jgi:transposase
MEKRSVVVDFVKQKYETISCCLNERGRRLWAATEAAAYGRGGIALLCEATGLSNNTIHKGLKELNDPATMALRSVRKKGGGRKKLTENNNEILKALDNLIEPTARGDPESVLRWTSKSLRNLAKALEKEGYEVSYPTVANLLRDLDYSLQSNKKTLEGKSHKDRDAQFIYINQSVMAMQAKGQPTLSVDTKKKENIGEYKNNGQELCKKGKPVKVNTHDFPNEKLGKVVPYGIYDIGKNKGWVSVGISGDTAEFAVNAIRTWWYKTALHNYQEVSEILITADCGGSNGYRVRLWKVELQKLADETNLTIHIRHFPPGTSKWNKIEHRLFSYISKNWRGKPLISKEAVVNLIGSTSTTKGLKVEAVLDENEYKTGRKISKAQMTTINIERDEFHPEWNYTIKPKKSK